MALTLFLVLVFFVGVCLGWNDPQQTQFHVRPEANWMNDPNGPLYWNGTYHLFFQYYPFAPIWSSMHWGHAVSRDLIMWKHLPIALYPDSNCDINGVWSGSATIGPNGPLLLYAGVNSDGQVGCLAYPKDLTDPELKDWVKYPQNPVFEAPQGGDPNNFRDPTTAWKVNDGYVIAVGATYNGKGTALQFFTRDFYSYKFLNPIWMSNAHPNMWECPDFFQINGQWVLKYSADGQDWFTIGTYDENSFTFTSTSDTLPVDASNVYASKSFYDPVQKRQIFWSWVREEDNGGISRGWQSSQSLPSAISIDQDLNRVLLNPIPEVTALRKSPGYVVKNTPITPSKEFIVPSNMYGDQMEI